jgi:hypothetical protein
MTFMDSFIWLSGWVEMVFPAIMLVVAFVWHSLHARHGQPSGIDGVVCLPSVPHYFSMPFLDTCPVGAYSCAKERCQSRKAESIGPRKRMSRAE